MYNYVYLRGWRKSSSSRILNLLWLQSKRIIFFEINRENSFVSMLLWISFQCRLSNYLHTINGRRFKIVTFHLIRRSYSLHTRSRGRAPTCPDVMNRPALWLLPRRHHLFSQLLFIVSAHHFSKETHKKPFKWQHLWSYVQVERVALHFTLQARHHSPHHPGATVNVHVRGVTVFCLFWKWHSWYCCVVRMTEEASSSVVCPSSFADLKLACSTLEKLHSVFKKALCSQRRYVLVSSQST